MKKPTRPPPTKPRRADFDSPWKDLLEKYFQQFMEYFFPQAAAGIDWSRGFEFLDKEFQQVVRDAKLGRRYADKLVRVREKNGPEAWVLAHVEIQGDKDLDLEKRMFVYNYRIFDRHARRVASLALLADTDEDWRPSEFNYELWGCGLRFWFPVVKILDFDGKEPAPGCPLNPFAVAVAAHRKAQTTRNDMTKRLTVKWSITKALYRAGFSRETILDLIRFIDWVMALPPELDDRFKANILKFEEKQNMTYITSIERSAIRLGEKLGEKRGEKLGEKRGEKRGEERKRKAMQGVARRLLTLGESLKEVVKLTGLTLAEVEALQELPKSVKDSTAAYHAKPRPKAKAKAKPRATAKKPSVRETPTPYRAKPRSKARAAPRGSSRRTTKN